MNKLYSVHDHWTDINKKNDVDIESIDGVIAGIKVNGEDYSGGGSSDFSTAEVTLIGKEGSITGDVYLPITQDAGDGMPDMAYFRASFVVNEQHTFNAIMYKGSTVGLIANAVGHPIDSIVGNAQDMGNGYLLITGDCTITIS